MSKRPQRPIVYKPTEKYCTDEQIGFYHGKSTGGAKMYDEWMGYIQSERESLLLDEVRLGCLISAVWTKDKTGNPVPELVKEIISHQRAKLGEECPTCKGTTTIPTDRSDFDMCPDCNPEPVRGVND
jgi:hypothetical protein